jgi:hypothetical protein
MARKLRLKLILLASVVVLCAAYAGLWYHLAGEVRVGVQNWAEARRAEGFTVGWDRYTISGFPFALRITVEKPVFGKASAAPGYEAKAPLLVGEARPWAFRQWHVSAANGAALNIEPAQDRPAMKLNVATLDVTTRPQKEDEAPETGAPQAPGTLATIVADRVIMDIGAHVAIAHAAIEAVLPSRPAKSHLEIWSSATVAIDHMTLPSAVPPLGDTVDRINAALALKGTIPPGPRREALAAWRADGGTLEVTKLDLGWGDLGLAANGTLALDEALQPEGALTASIRGYNAIIDAMVAGGTMKAGDGALAKLALGLLAKTGSDGTSHIDAPLTMQGGRLFIGPARLARLPNFTWE